MITNEETTALRIKKLRQHLKLSQAGFGKALAGTDQSTIAGWEGGKRSISPQAIELICAKYNVRKAWLVSGEGEMYPVEIAEKTQPINYSAVEKTEALRRQQLEMITILTSQVTDLSAALNRVTKENEELRQQLKEIGETA